MSRIIVVAGNSPVYRDGAPTIVSEDCNVSIWSSLEMECVVRGMSWSEYMTFHCKGAKLSEAGYTALNALFNLEFEKEVANG